MIICSIDISPPESLTDSNSIPSEPLAAADEPKAIEIQPSAIQETTPGGFHGWIGTEAALRETQGDDHLHPTAIHRILKRRLVFGDSSSFTSDMERISKIQVDKYFRRARNLRLQDWMIEAIDPVVLKGLLYPSKKKGPCVVPDFEEIDRKIGGNLHKLHDEWFFYARDNHEHRIYSKSHFYALYEKWSKSKKPTPQATVPASREVSSSDTAEREEGPASERSDADSAPAVNSPDARSVLKSPGAIPEALLERAPYRPEFGLAPRLRGKPLPPFKPRRGALRIQKPAKSAPSRSLAQTVAHQAIHSSPLSEPSSPKELAKATDPGNPLLDFRKHIDPDGHVRELTVRDIYRELALDIDFGEHDCIPEESFVYAEIDELVERIELCTRAPLMWEAGRPNGEHFPTSVDFGPRYSDSIFHLVNAASAAGMEKLYRRSARFVVFHEAIAESGATHTNLRKPSGRFSEEKMNWEVGNELLELIWEKTQEIGYKKHALLTRMHSEKNFASGKKLIDRAFDKHPDLLVVRMDLGFQKAIRNRLSLEDVQAYLESFLKRSRSKALEEVFGHLVGYIRKLEHKPQKWYHYHLVFFFDGKKVKGEFPLVEAIGKFWMETITGGYGVFQDCSGRPYGYRSCGVGLINATNTVEREILTTLCMGYLAKSDDFCKPADAQVRRFQTSIIDPRKLSARQKDARWRHHYIEQQS